VSHLVLLHTNDIHGRIDALARVATLVEQIRAEERDATVLYADVGDVEETTTRLSNLTKGVAMHSLLSAAGCDVACVGNAAWLRYGPQVLAEQARAARYPLLLANLRPVPGTTETAIVAGVGFIGITDPFRSFLESGLDYGLEALDEVGVVERCARELRAAGAELVVCLSHLGLNAFPGGEAPPFSDRDLASALQGVVDVVLGGHTHDLLPDGEWVGNVLVAQAGEYGRHLGRVDVRDGAITATVLPVAEDLPRHPAVLAAAGEAEAALEAGLDEVVARLEHPLDARWIAELLRERLGAEIGLVISGNVLDRALPAGPLRRRDLWETCHTTANPGLAEVTGSQLRHMIARGADPEFERATPRILRGRPRGRLEVVGAPADIDPTRTYRVAATDYELERYGGLIDAEWNLRIAYDFPTIVREAIEEALARRAP
jgi:2',3'-cyclic-nucleotide 2'-phosphodiesterase (5'-nucleotidase family)